MKQFKFRWVHLSDIHYAYKNSHTNRIRERLIHILKEKNTEASANCLIITGDITDKSCEYADELYDFLNSIGETLNIDKKDIFIIPGNHDIKRSDVRTKLLTKIYQSENIYNTIEKLSQEKCNILISAQNDYWEMYKKIKGELPPNLNQIHYIEKRTDYNIIHLNTSWLCEDNGTESRLHIGVDRLSNILIKAGLSQNTINIAIGHHCLEWMDKKEQEQIRSLFKDYNIDFYLSGHIHQSMISYNCGYILLCL